MFLRRLVPLSRSHRVLILRVCFLSVVFLEGLVVPSFVDKRYFAELELLKNIAWTSLIGITGFTGGSQFLYFQRNHKDIFSDILGPFIITAILVSLGFSFYYEKPVILLICFSVLLCQFNEQVFKINECFYLSFLVKPIISMIILILVISFRLSVETTVLIAFTSTAIFFQLIRAQRLRLVLGWNWKVWKDTLSSGLPLSLGTGIYLLMMLFEREFGMTHFKSKMDVYSLVINFNGLTTVILSTLAYVYSIEIGKNLSSGNLSQFLKKRLFMASLIGFVLFAASALTVPKVAEYLYPEYGVITISEYLVIGLPRVIFFTVGSVTSFLLYHQKLKLVTSLSFVGLIGQVIAYEFTKDKDFISFVTILSTIIVVLSFFSLFIVFKTLTEIHAKSQKGS